MRPDEITSTESEAGIIASLIYHPDYVFQYDELLPEHFANRHNRTIYMALQDLAIKNVPRIDAYIINADISGLEANGVNIDSIDINDLKEFVENAELIARHTPEEYAILVKNVMDCAFRRDTIHKLRQCESMCMDKTVEDIKDQVSSTIDGVLSKYVGTDDVPLFCDVIDDIWDEIKEKQGGTYSGITFDSFPTLNDYCTLEPGELICIGAEQKDGKSMFLTNVSADLLKSDIPFVYIDSELPTRQFTVRLLSNLTKIPFKRIKSGDYSPEEEERIDKAIVWLKSRRFVHKYVPILDQNTLLTIVKRVNHQLPLKVFIVDYFKSTGELGAFENSQQMGNIINMCKNVIAGGMKIAGIGACQLNPDGTIAESKKIGRYVSTMVLLRTKTENEIIDDGGPEYGNKYLKVVLNRNGHSHGEGEYIDIDFEGDYCSMKQAKFQHQVQSRYYSDDIYGGGGRFPY